MPIYFLRHVKTYNNLNEILSGRTETNILPNQSIVFSSAPEVFDIVYSSTATRCKDTLLLIPSAMLPTKIVYTDALLERSLGILENLPRYNAIRDFPDLFANGKIDVDSVISGAESINDIKTRVNSLTHKILDISLKKQCLICSHNQTLKVMYSIIKDIKISNMYWNNTNFNPGIITKIT